MAYLLPTEYAAFGLSAETADAWVRTASAMIDAHCRRPTLMSSSYTERMRVSRRTQSVALSFGPLVSVDAFKAKYARPHVDEEIFAPVGTLGQFVSDAFGYCDQWMTLDPMTLDVDMTTGECRFRWNVFGYRYDEVEISYTAGLATVPDAVKVACAQIVRNAQATPALNVKRSRLDKLQTEYFSDSLLDSQVQMLLRPYLAERLG